MNNGKKIKIVHLTSSLKFGGAETLLGDLISHLGHDQFEHHVLYFHEGPHSERLKLLGVKTYHIKGIICCYDPLFLMRLFTSIRQINPRCIHALLWAANFLGRIIGRLLKIPTICVVHRQVDDDGYVRTMLDRLTLSFFDTIVAVSDDVKRSFIDHFPKEKLPSIQVIPNGIDAQAIEIQGLQFPKTRYELGLGEEHFIIGSVGRFHAVKRFELLLESFALLNVQYPLTRLIIIGSGAQADILYSHACSLGIEQDVLLVKDQPALSYYPLFDCFALSSNQEGISMAMLEAMSFGLPCVVTSGNKEHPVLKSGYNGLLVEAGNSRQLAQSLGKLVENHALRLFLGRNAKRSVTHLFGIDAMVNSYRALFIECSLKKYEAR